MYAKSIRVPLEVCKADSYILGRDSRIWIVYEEIAYF